MEGAEGLSYEEMPALRYLRRTLPPGPAAPFDVAVASKYIDVTGAQFNLELRKFLLDINLTIAWLEHYLPYSKTSCGVSSYRSGHPMG